MNRISPWTQKAGLLIPFFLIAASGLCAQELPPHNAWLTDSLYPTSHHNPAQTDTTSCGQKTHPPIYKLVMSKYASHSLGWPKS